jgi:hypothetical protein
MSTKKTTRTTTVEVEITQAGLTAQEEKVLRLRRGIGAPADHVLEFKATPNARAREALLALEREMVHKRQALAAKAEERKKKIVSTLRSRSKR